MKYFIDNRPANRTNYGKPSPFRSQTFTRRYGRSRQRLEAVLLPGTVALCAYARARSVKPIGSSGIKDSEVRLDLQCPACALRSQINEFEFVRFEVDAHIHCPHCDANLGQFARAIQNAS